PHLLKSKRIAAVFGGGGQEFGLRSGTENIIGIAGFAAAAKEGSAALADSLAQMRELSARLVDGLQGSEIRPNLPAERAPHIISLTLPQIKSETMLHFLSAKGIYVSSGSACSSHAANPSSALLGFGLPAAEADTTIRVSLCPQNTAAEIDALLSALAEGVASLVRIRR
ncbi:MAG: aminotransferase class V-fold PLP-dependent enzyme, partial [Clostridia bacterium]|nr:aminotransferase class V-fold PLP-dependent enzyme [Clostridia bacterium]